MFRRTQVNLDEICPGLGGGGSGATMSPLECVVNLMLSTGANTISRAIIRASVCKLTWSGECRRAFEGAGRGGGGFERECHGSFSVGNFLGYVFCHIRYFDIFTRFGDIRR